jgi:hypothetical protein
MKLITLDVSIILLANRHDAVDFGKNYKFLNIAMVFTKKNINPVKTFGVNFRIF